jgi:hypothetical protein
MKIFMTTLFSLHLSAATKTFAKNFTSRFCRFFLRFFSNDSISRENTVIFFQTTVKAASCRRPRTLRRSKNRSAEFLFIHFFGAT